MKWYKVVLNQITPVHVGKRIWGVLSETEVFIPGWTVAGALTHLCLLSRINSATNNEDILNKFQVITNFYPVLKNGEKEKILFPQFENSNFYLGDYLEDEFRYKEDEFRYKEDKFRYKYVEADFKTAVEPILRKAKDENLYEFEYIVPEFKWVGLIKLEESIKKKLENFKEIFIGGDVKYGYGRFTFTVKELEEEEKEKELKKFNLSLEEEGIKIKNTEEPIRCFVEFKDAIKDKISLGIPRLYTRLNFRGATPVVEEAYFLLPPGSKIKYEGPFSLEFGILKPTS